MMLRGVRDRQQVGLRGLYTQSENVQLMGGAVEQVMASLLPPSQ